MIQRVGQFEIHLNPYRTKKRKPDYYGYYPPGNKYIHSDGELREFTLYGKAFSGYFSTIEEVKQAIDLYNKLNAK